jgi:2-polyprenyl-3-methyl-5-hydroxy-6-metoxy-1,4-benzoquinol methylase
MQPRATTFDHELALILADADKLIVPLLDSINVDDISQHNFDYKSYNKDRFRHFIEAEKTRFITATKIIYQDFKGGTICDLGTFIPYFPIILASLGYDVTIVDTYKLYGSNFENSIRELAEKKSIKVVDLNILNDSLDSLGIYDVVLLMAVVEHLNGSPRELMQKIYKMISPDGCLIFEVPNMVEFHRRIQFLLGRSPLPDYQNYFSSDYPFMGHNREMTMAEVTTLMRMSGFTIEKMLCYDYTKISHSSIKGHLASLAKFLMPVKDKGQVITVKAKPLV